MTSELFAAASDTPRLLQAATEAVKANRPILVSTPERLVDLKRAATRDLPTDPFDIDLDRLLAGDELLYLLSARCETAQAGEVGPDSSPALYLTPIERPLAAALEAEGIAWEAQVPIGSYRADFLVDGRLVVEADGARWHDSGVDEARDRVLAGLGYPTLRLTGRAVFGDLNGCIRRVKDALAETDVARPAYELMTPAQTLARDHIDGPALVVAPAGSGKTRVVTERIKRLVELGADPSRICAISFTNVAVEEMANRLAADPKPGLDDVHATTLHRLANDIRRGAGLTGQVIGDGAGASPGTPTRWRIIQGVLMSSEYRGTAGAGKLWVEKIADYRTRLEIPDLEGLPLAGDLAQQQARFVKVHHRYEEQLRAKNVTDFDGLVLDATRILAEDRTQRLLWSSRYDHFIVDEYQDLPPAKLSLLRLLASPARNLMVVGDDDQIIYGFAGASPLAFARMQDAWRDLRELPLDRNFRSPHDLVVRTNWLIKRNQRRVDKKITPDRPLRKPSSVVVLNEEGYEKPALDFVRNERKRGTRPSQIVLLFRLSSLAAPVELALEMAGIPHTPLARESLVNDATVKWARCWLRVINQSPQPDDYRQTLLRPTRYFSRETIDHLVSADNVEAALKTAIANPMDVPRKSTGQPDGLLQDALVQYLATVEGARAVGPTPQAVLSALQLDKALAAEEPAKDKNAQAQARRSTDPKVMIRVVSRLAASAATIDDLEAWFDNRDDPDIVAAQKIDNDPAVADRILLTTIHKAKGREWSSVAVLGPPNSMPDPRADTPEAVEEERRMAYVAATRAQQRLLFCSSAIYAAELSRSPEGLDWQTYYAINTGQLAAETRPSTFIAQEPAPPVSTEARPASLLEAIKDLWHRLVG